MTTENAPTDQTSNGQPSNEKVTDDIKNIEQEVISESRKDEVKPTVEEPTSTEPVKEVEEKKTELMVVVPTKEDTKEPAPIVEDSSSTEVVSSKQEDEIKETDVPAVDDKDPSSDILTVDQSKGLEETKKDSEAPTVSEPTIEAQQKELIGKTNSAVIPDTGDKEVEKLTVNPEVVEELREIRQPAIEIENTPVESYPGDKLEEKLEMPIAPTRLMEEEVKLEEQPPISETIEKVDEETELPNVGGYKDMLKEAKNSTEAEVTAIAESIENTVLKADVNVEVEENKEEETGDDIVSGLVKGVVESAGLPDASAAVGLIKSIDSTVSEISEGVTKTDVGEEKVEDENVVFNERTPVDVKETEEKKDELNTDEVTVASKEIDVKETAGELQESEVVGKTVVAGLDKSERGFGVVEKVVECRNVDEPAKDGSDVKLEENQLKQEVPAKKPESNNLISKVKHLIVKAKKAILGKSPNSKAVSSEGKGEGKGI